MWKAVLFDRDETISYDDPNKLSELSDFIDRLLDKPGFFRSLTIEDWRELLWDALDKHNMGYFDVNTVQKEIFIWKEFFKNLLVREGYVGNLQNQADQAFNIFNILEIIRPYPESEQVLKTLKHNGYLIGIVSNCFPTLKESLKMIDLDKYIDCFVNSSSVGFRKPDRGIYQLTLDRLGTTPQETIFVDNLEENVVAARQMGITAFHIDRDLDASDMEQFKLSSLTGVLEYLGINST